MASADWIMVSPPPSKRSSQRTSLGSLKAPIAPTPTFNLPTELRIKIYKLALISPEPLNLLHNGKGLRLAHIYQPTYPWPRFHLARNLLLVSRTTYEEAAAILYGENTFQFAYDLDTVQLLLEKLLPSTRSSIRRINLQGAGSLSFQSINFDAQLARLGDIRRTLGTLNPWFRLQSLGFEAPIAVSGDEQHRRRLAANLLKLFRLKVATTIKFSGYCGNGTWQRWDDAGFARAVERCLDEGNVGAQVCRVPDEESFSQKRSSVNVTFVQD